MKNSVRNKLKVTWAEARRISSATAFMQLRSDRAKAFEPTVPCGGWRWGEKLINGEEATAILGLASALFQRWVEIMIACLLIILCRP